MLTEVEGAEPGGSLEVPVALAEVEGAEPGGAPAKVVMSGGVCRGFLPWRSGDVVERPQ